MHFSAPPRTSQLAAFVGALGYYESALPAGRDRVLPGGSIDIMVNLHEDEFRTYHGPGATAVRRAPGAVLVGAEKHAVVIDTADQRRGLSVTFTAAGAAAFFGLPLGDVAGQLVGLEALWGRDGSVLRDRLLGAADPRRQFTVLEEILRQHLAEPPPHRAAMGHAAAELTLGRNVGNVGTELGLSPAHVYPAVP
jgi:hypothetical protein